MRIIFINIIILILSFTPKIAFTQPDITPPISPVLQSVSVLPETGFTDLTWTLSSSIDVAGYVVYSFENNEGYAIDTIWDPTATSYINTNSSSVYFSESYVIAALDGSENVSPLSNAINTIFSEAIIDTCNNSISINWNKYPDIPHTVSGYTIMASVNNNEMEVIANVDKQVTTYTFTGFETDTEYCFVVRANTGSTPNSFSNKTCITTKMQKTPAWINADFATVEENGTIRLSFSYDPLAETNHFKLERREGLDGTFSTISDIRTNSNPVIYIDEIANISQVYYYRLSAINNCNSTVLTSNITGNILPVLKLSDSDIFLSWNPYREWNGTVFNYKIFSDVNGIFGELADIPSPDSTYSFQYSDIMYKINSDKVCFYVIAYETENPFGANGVSTSSVVCTEILDLITVPNAFTPNNDLQNDLFKPVLSFTPVDYLLIIRDRQGYLVFETKDPLSEWDGKKNGSFLPPEVYLWFVNVTSPSGKTYSKTGTVTILNK